MGTSTYFINIQKHLVKHLKEEPVGILKDLKVIVLIAAEDVVAHMLVQLDVVQLVN